MLTKQSMSQFSSGRLRSMSARCDDYAFAGVPGLRGANRRGSRRYLAAGRGFRRGFCPPAAAAKARITFRRNRRDMSSKDLVLVSNMRLNFTQSFETF
jgi:hypothetical protein